MPAPGLQCVWQCVAVRVAVCAVRCVARTRATSYPRASSLTNRMQQTFAMRAAQVVSVAMLCSTCCSAVPLVHDADTATAGVAQNAVSTIQFSHELSLHHQLVHEQATLAESLESAMATSLGLPLEQVAVTTTLVPVGHRRRAQAKCSPSSSASCVTINCAHPFEPPRPQHARDSTPYHFGEHRA